MLRSAARLLEESAIFEDSAHEMHCIVAHKSATAFRRDLAAKCFAAGMWFSTAQMWDAVANALQAKMLLDYLRTKGRSCVLAKDSDRFLDIS